MPCEWVGSTCAAPLYACTVQCKVFPAISRTGSAAALSGKKAASRHGAVSRKWLRAKGRGAERGGGGHFHTHNYIAALCVAVIR